MPGERLEDALGEAGALAARGIPSTVTLLGENVETSEEATAVADEFLQALDEAERRELDVEVSVKLTHLGLDRDPGRARALVARLARRAEGRGRVWIDMEASQYVDATLDLFRQVRAEHENVGLCLQSYLYRTERDLEGLLPLDPAIRLVKGAYAEPPSIAYAKKADADASFELLAALLLDHFAGGGSGFLVLGTHDERLIDRLRAMIAERGIAESAYEFAMLYGIGLRQQQALASDGAPLRVLISYGSAWFPWYMRRLAERPANIWFVLRNLLR
jgi:proline dehydrogenase